ncbi:GSCOCG00007293001-RA-CDS [Cotesia congregata]|nr:GSCOCG00007293001-RA-CDS [Cotesia congregata]
MADGPNLLPYFDIKTLGLYKMVDVNQRRQEDTK